MVAHLFAEAQQPLHLYLSSTNPKSLEAARSLAENLLDTISAEYGASRSVSLDPLLPCVVSRACDVNALRAVCLAQGWSIYLLKN